MEPIRMMINGLPGNMAQVIARQAMADDRFAVLPYSMTGPDIDISSCEIEGTVFKLIVPDARDGQIGGLVAAHAPFISVDFTHPSGVNENARFYCRHQLPFVMGTTSGNREQLLETVNNSEIAAVIAPNMAKQIVGFQAMMAHAAEHFPNLFKGYHLTIRESHQAGKADTSGTAKAMVGYFNRMGIPFTAEQIEKERDPERQSNMWVVPPDYLGGHGWHTYTLLSNDQTVKFEFVHNVNGREVYAEGTLDAVVFLALKVAQGIKGHVFSMIDVLTAGAEL
jgi:4-hydroxy-tetrahydrodipicolinate reductase